MTRLALLLTTVLMATAPAYAEEIPHVEMCIPPQVASLGCVGGGGTIETGPVLAAQAYVGGSCTYAHILGSGPRIQITGTFAASPANPTDTSVSCHVYVDRVSYKSLRLTGGGNPMTFQGVVTLPMSYGSMYVCWTGSASWPHTNAFHTNC
jgi:hypothetical protein